MKDKWITVGVCDVALYTTSTEQPMEDRLIVNLNTLKSYELITTRYGRQFLKIIDATIDKTLFRKLTIEKQMKYDLSIEADERNCDKGESCVEVYQFSNCVLSYHKIKAEVGAFSTVDILFELNT